MKKIAVITSSRADWGLLKPVVEKLDSPFLIITGSHLSPEHGMTINEISNDLPLHPVEWVEEVEILLSSDTEKGVCSAAGLTLIKFGELFDRIKPDLVLILGDRFEVLSACMAAHIYRIPIAHISGGDISGNYDNAFRHCITQLSTYHFPATEKARDLIIQMRLWDNKNVHNVGALGCDGLVKRTNEPDNKYIVINHSETLENSMPPFIFLDGEVINIRPNADNGNYGIDARLSNSETMTRERFLVELSESKAIIGNSSCGIIEAPALGVPTINIGNRQQGRERASSIIDCEPNQESIKQALTRLESKDFQDLMKTDYYMPYQGENVAGKIVEVLNKL